MSGIACGRRRRFETRRTRAIDPAGTGTQVGELTFVVADDGPGFGVAADAGFGGIANMKDRMVVVLGELTIVSTPNTGTTIRGKVPVSPRE